MPSKATTQHHRLHPRRLASGRPNLTPSTRYACLRQDLIGYHSLLASTLTIHHQEARHTASGPLSCIHRCGQSSRSIGVHELCTEGMNRANS
eukprot:3170383-Prymnesium_polylepis.1